MIKMCFKVSFVLFALFFVSSCGNKSGEQFIDGKNAFNKGWEFVKDVDLPIGEILRDKNIPWQNVSLPHTANIEPLVIKGDQWQGDCVYRKNFRVPKKLSGKHLALYFEGAMQVAEVYLNGQLLHTNLGGYLPFYVEISDEVKFGSENCLAVKLNNEDNPLVAPGKALDVLDFNIYSGIYRNVWLEVKDPVHITHELEVEREAGGGVFVSYDNVSEKSAEINVQVDVINEKDSKEQVVVDIKLLNSGEVVTEMVSELNTIEAHSTSVIKQQLQVDTPHLWSPSSPHLYSLQLNLKSGSKILDSRELKIGVRSISMTAKDGFLINGKPLKLRGTNRHQEYPYVGYAISDNANYRDAWKIKDAGFNFVRLSHYPQSQSFLNACDELGILVMDAIPGWQFFGNEEFQQNAIRNIREMVRVDRNHPSIILWEASLNESAMSREFMEKAHQAVHDEYPGEDVYTCGWLDDVYDVFIPARQHGKPPYYWNRYAKDKPLFIAEYGDWEYYAQNAGFNQKAYKDLSDEERNSRQLRGHGQKRLAQQALNYQEAHNSNLQGKAIGDANWLMFDYNRGYAPDIEASGIMDIFRLPKFAYYFYKSQAIIGESELEAFAKPMLFIANYYNDPSCLDVRVYSNCEEVELMVNGKSLGKQKPDKDANSTHLMNPPFTFKLPAFTPGELVAKGYVNGKLTIEAIQRTPGNAKAIKLWIDQSGKELESNCNDIVFAYAAIVDENGTVLPLAKNSVRFSLTGNAEIMGGNPINAEAGIATVLLKAGESPGDIELSALSEGLETGKLKIKVK